MAVQDHPESGFTLVEVLCAMGVSAVVLVSVAGLLGASHRAVADAELETTATLIAAQVIEEWRSRPLGEASGRDTRGRDGRRSEGGGLFDVEWMTTSPAPESAQLEVTVRSTRLRTPVIMRALVMRTAR